MNITIATTNITIPLEERIFPKFEIIRPTIIILTKRRRRRRRRNTKTKSNLPPVRGRRNIIKIFEKHAREVGLN